MDTLRDKETLDYLWESRQAQWKRWQGSCRLFEMYKKTAGSRLFCREGKIER